MATFKSIQPTDENIRGLQNSLNDADITVQGAYDKIRAAVVSIELMIKELDDIGLRRNIKAMCEIIDFHAADAEGVVNSEAEKWGADYISDETRELILQVEEAANSKA